MDGATAGRDAWELTLAAMAERRKLGITRYGKPVLSDDAGEDWLQHAFEEVLDLAVYLRAEIERRKDAAAERERCIAIVREEQDKNLVGLAVRIEARIREGK